MRDDTTARAIDIEREPAMLKRGEVLVTQSVQEARRAPSTESTRPGATPLVLPYEMHFMDRDGRPRSCEVVAEIGGGGFRLAQTGRSFDAELYVALKDRSEGWSRYELPQPVKILVTAAVDHLAPKLLSLQATNDWATVALSTVAPAHEVPVKLRPSVDGLGLELKVPVNRPRLSVFLSPAEVQGFGLDSASVQIRVDGHPTPQGRAITLTSSGGRLAESRLVLDAEGTASTELRSVGLGSVHLTAQGPQLVEGRANVRFLWPWRFLVSAMLGALVAALVSVVRKRSPQGQRAQHAAMELGAGVLTGLIAAVAYAAGVDLFSATLPSIGGEALVFTAAALGALGLATKLSSSERSAPSSAAPAAAQSRSGGNGT